MNEFKDKVVVVTGGAKGIGKCIIADMVMYLCSDKASFITGENIMIDGGMSKLMIYHNDNGWTLN